MTPERWAVVKQEFLKLLDLPVGAREAVLGALRESDPELAQTLEQMLAAEEDPEFLIPERTAGADANAIPRIPGYEVLEEIGRGGMGVVYRARQLKPARVVAIKVLRSHALLTPRDVERFRREANAVARVQHPGVVAVYEVGVSEGNHYFSMEFVSGRTLTSVLDDVVAASRGEATKQPLELPAFGERGYVRAVVEVIAGVADALSAAHAHTIVHRDVKPSNVLLSPDGKIKLVDFGIARDESQGRITISREMPGTPDYMSPEQVRASQAAVDHRTDIYSLGAVLYQLLTLKRPYEGTSQLELPSRIISPQPPQSVASLNPKIPRDLRSIVETAMAKEASDRYATAAAFRDDLLRFLANEAVVAKPRSVAHRGRLWLARNRRRLAAASLGLLVVASTALGIQLHAANDRTFAWLDVESDQEGSVVILQRFDPASLDLEPAARRLGSTPLRQVSVPPGYYRVTVHARDGGFAEFDVLLEGTGKERGVRIHAGGGPPAGGALNGVLATAADVAEGMLAVPAGDYAVGHSTDSNPTMLAHTVHLAAFSIDAREVSNAEFASFVKAGWPAPAAWKERDLATTAPDLPVTGITLEDAQAYAQWKGKRLPTMFEWQAATRGTSGDAYPWGNGPGADAAALEPRQDVLAGGPAREEAQLLQRYLASVVATTQADPRTTARGLVHAFGNVRELTATIDLSRHAGVVMGRCGLDQAAANPLGTEWLYPLGTHSIMHGFRCAKSAAPSHPSQ